MISSKVSHLILITWFLHFHLILMKSRPFESELRYVWFSHDARWHAMLQTAINVYSLQHSTNLYAHLHSSSNHIALVYPSDMWKMAVRFQDMSSSLNFTSYFFDMQLDLDYSFEDAEMASKIFEPYLHKSPRAVRTVVAFSEDDKWISNFAQALCSNVNLKWTYLIHITEWILIIDNRNISIELNSETVCFDFVTYIKASEEGVLVSRKSRWYNLKSFRRCQNLHEMAWPEAELGNLFTDLQRKRKSSLDGLHVPIGFLTSAVPEANKEKTEIKTTYDRFSVALLNTLASILGFTYSLVSETDGGLYGYVNDDGTSVGLVGLVARREVAFAATGLNRIANRLAAIDFLDHPIDKFPCTIVYAVKDNTDQLDLTLVDIITTEYYLLLIGPCVLIAFIGGLVHVSTKSCTVAPSSCFRKQELRRLASFPDQICFQTGRRIVGQTGRVLRASWAVFFVIFSAAYSAYLVTTFTVKQPELKLNSFQALVRQTQYRFGVHCSMTSIITLFQTSSDGDLQEIWRRLVDFNKTDPWTLSCNLTEHMLNVAGGSYAFFPPYEILNELQDEFPVDIQPKIRLSPFLNSDGLGPSYISLPYYSFFREELNDAVVMLEESGLLAYYNERYFSSGSNKIDDTSLESTQSVTLSKILLLVFVTMGGIAVGFLCLLVEVFIVKAFTIYGTV